MELQVTKAIAISNLFERVRMQKLPVRTMYKFTKLFKAIEEETKYYYDKLRELINLYAEKDENGNIVQSEDKLGVKIQEESLGEFQLELDDLVALEINLPDISFSLNELEGVDLSFDEFNMLMPLIKEE